MGGQSSYHQQSNTHQQEGRAYATGATGGSPYGAAQASSTRNAYSTGGDSEPKKGKGKIVALVVGLVILAIVAFGGTTASSFIRTRRIFRRRQARSCIRSRP